MNDKSHRQMRKEWKKISGIKEIKSKKEIFIILFWSGLMLYSILSLAISITSLFADKGNVDIYINGKSVAIDYLYLNTSGWSSSDANKIIKITLSSTMFIFITYIYYSFMIKKVNPAAVRILLLFTIMNIIYRASNLPSYYQSNINKKNIFFSFLNSSGIDIKNIIVWEMKTNLIAWITINNFLIRILCLAIPVGISLISLVAILLSSNIDKIIFR